MTGADPQPMFDRVALIGIGLIGSSLSHAIRRGDLASEISVSTRSQETLDRARELNLGDDYTTDAAKAVEGADLIVLSVPLGAMGAVAQAISGNLKPGAIVTDAGSSKTSVIADISPHIPDGVHFVPGHPIAGTEHSGPDAGFAELFDHRWCILTPLPHTDKNAVDRVTEFWTACGSNIEIMESQHHDKVLAITSHLPQLIAYCIVDTATDLETHLQSEVIKFSASGFQDFTRLAASDPVMWRDVCLKNRDAVLDVLSQFTEDLTALRRSIRRGEGDDLQKLFTRTRAIRREVIDANQD
jgi:cyclohexadieny/prephenate dehydrogenase